MKKLSILLIVGGFIILGLILGYFMWPKGVNNSLVQNNNQSNTENYVIDLSSDVDTSSWPTFTNTKYGWSIKYHPDGRWRSNDMYLGPEEAPGPAFETTPAGSLSLDYIISVDVPFSTFENWFTNNKEAFVVAERKDLQIANRPAAAQLKNLGGDTLAYLVYVYNSEKRSVYVFSFPSGITNDPKDSSQIFKAMLQTLTFREN